MQMFKLINPTTIQQAPRRFYKDRMLIVNPTEEILRTMGYLPLIAEPQPEVPDGYTAKAHYALSEDGQSIVQTWVVKEPIKIWSKLKIVQALYAAGLFDQFMAMLNANALMKALWDASNVIESNSLFAERLPAIAEGMGKTEDEIRAMLADCLAE